MLEGRSDVKVVGDRFVFQSEVLFEPGQASIGSGGQEQLAQIAAALTEIIDQIPEDIPWILQIDGHTDDVPVTGVYADNWDLSTERALSVVRFMIKKGCRPHALQPLAMVNFNQLQRVTPWLIDRKIGVSS